MTNTGMSNSKLCFHDSLSFMLLNENNDVDVDQVWVCKVQAIIYFLVLCYIFNIGMYNKFYI